MAVALGRSAVGYEINAAYIGKAVARLEARGARLTVVQRRKTLPAGPRPSSTWRPSVPDMEPVAEPAGDAPPFSLQTVVAVSDDCSLTLDTGTRVRFADLRIADRPGARAYLLQRVRGKKVILKDEVPGEDGFVRARVLLKNRISINAYLLKTGMADRVNGTGA